MSTKNLGQVQALWVSSTAPTNTNMLWFDTNTGIKKHKYYDTDTSTWETFIINTASLPLIKDSANIEIQYDTDQFELVAGVFTIKADVLASVTPPFTISQITDLQTTLDSKVSKVTGKSLISDTEITRLASVFNYTHPATHLPSVVAQDSSNRFVSDAEKNTWNSKQSALGFTPYNATNPDGFMTAAEFEAISSLYIRVYEIFLSAESTVQGRVDLASAGTDYPTGWSMSAYIDNAHDLYIEHNLGKRIIDVKVYTVDGDSERLLYFNSAYSGILAIDNNTLLIEGLATIETDIVIHLIFA